MVSPADADRRAKAAEVLARGGSVSEAARQSGYHRTALHRIMRRDDFQQRLERERAALGQAAAKQPDPPPLDGLDAILLKATQTGIAVLARLARDPDVAPRDRVAAAKALADLRKTPPPPPKAPAARPQLGPPHLRLLGPLDANKAQDEAAKRLAL